jgi:hypothetical protein
MVDFIVLYAETFPILPLYTVINVVCIMIYFFEIHINEGRKGFCIQDNKIYHMYSFGIKMNI